jgi:hypothetical protein
MARGVASDRREREVRTRVGAGAWRVALGPLATVDRSGASWSASPSARSRTCQRAILRDQGSSLAGRSKNRYAAWCGAKVTQPSTAPAPSRLSRRSRDPWAVHLVMPSRIGAKDAVVER